MLRSIVAVSLKLQNSTPAFEVVGINASISQIVRWRGKKPSWLPPAKSKLFKVDDRASVPRDERIEMQRLQNYYRTYMKSIKQYLDKIEKLNQAEYNEEHVENLKQLDFERCQQINEEWNKKIALEREERLAKEWKEKEQIISETIAKAKDLEEKQLAESEAYIRKIKEDAAKFITREMLDQAIEEALNNEISYNVAIDLKGNKYSDIFHKPGVTIQAQMTN